MIVSWNRVPLSEARGIIVSYSILYQEISDEQTRHTVRNTLVVPGSESSMLIGGLNPSSTYQVFVRASTSAGDGPYSESPAVAITSMLHTMSFSMPM